MWRASCSLLLSRSVMEGSLWNKHEAEGQWGGRASSVQELLASSASPKKSQSPRCRYKSVFVWFINVKKRNTTQRQEILPTHPSILSAHLLPAAYHTCHRYHSAATERFTPTTSSEHLINLLAWRLLRDFQQRSEVKVEAFSCPLRWQGFFYKGILLPVKLGLNWQIKIR